MTLHAMDKTLSNPPQGSCAAKHATATDCTSTMLAVRSALSFMRFEQKAVHRVFGEVASRDTRLAMPGHMDH